MFVLFVNIYLGANGIIIHIFFSPLESFFDENEFSIERLQYSLALASKTVLFPRHQVNPSINSLFASCSLHRKSEVPAGDLSSAKVNIQQETTDLVLWYRPIETIHYALLESVSLIADYFLTPFWQFFFATIIGKALIKMSVQTIFIIVLFSEHHVERLIHWMRHLPVYGRAFQQPFEDWLREQKERMHRKSAEQLMGEQIDISILTQCFNAFLLLTITFFLLSIVNSLAQSHVKRRRVSM